MLRDAHDAAARLQRLAIRVLERFAIRQQLKLPGGLRSQKLHQPQPFASVPATHITQFDATTKANVTSRVQDPSGKPGIGRYMANVDGAVDLVTGRGIEYISCKGQGAKSDAAAEPNIMMQHILTTLVGEENIDLVLDNDADQHNNLVLKFAQLLVDLHVYRRCLVAFLYGYHAKGPADQMHSLFGGLQRVSDVLAVEDLALLASQLAPRLSGRVSNPAADVGLEELCKRLYVREPTQGHVTQFSVRLAADELDGHMLLRRSWTAGGWHQVVMRKPGCNTIDEEVLRARRAKLRGASEAGMDHVQVSEPYSHFSAQ